MTRRHAAVGLALGLVALAAPVVPARQTPASQSAVPDRQALAARVKAEFQHAWRGYKAHAWNHDDLNPVSRTPRDWYPPNVIYMTPVDSLDTMLIMGLTTEANEAKQVILDHLTFDLDASVQVFEITIRLLGGLLSAHQMTGEPRFLELADDLGRRMMPAFNSPTGMPYRFVNLRTGEVRGEVSNPAEIGTLILEFGTLAKLTKKPAYYDAAKKAITGVYTRRDPTTGLVGTNINVETGAWTNPSSHIGGAIDSYYEYLHKCERLFDDADCGAMFKDGLAAVNKYLADDTPNGLWYGVSSMTTGARTRTSYGSLQAFMPGMLAMAGDLDRARRLQDSGFRMWMLNGIEPEGIDYSTMRVTSAGYQLRPEIAESAYILSHYTKDPRYVDMGRTFFEALVQYCRVDDGYTVLQSVVTKEKGDRMHSFFLAETLKYLYLLFDPDALDFDQVTFNTEAHPLRRTW
jgi:mannosidase alpha-like ER degradation enhancer 2